jgi:hypothetical protein
MCERERRHVHLEAMFPAGSWDAVIADALSIDDILEAHEALEVIASLPARERADLTLLVAGFSYAEIAELTGGRTYTNVISRPRCQYPADNGLQRRRHVDDVAKLASAVAGLRRRLPGQLSQFERCHETLGSLADDVRKDGARETRASANRAADVAALVSVRLARGL